MTGFGGKLRWPEWRDDVAKAGPDRGFTASPPRWTPEGKHPKRANLRPVPMQALFPHEIESGRKLRDENGPRSSRS